MNSSDLQLHIGYNRHTVPLQPQTFKAFNLRMFNPDLFDDFTRQLIPHRGWPSI